MTTCAYPGCEYQDDQHRPYARKRDGIPSVTTIAGAFDVGDRARAFAWSASLIAADMGVHHTDQWWNLPNHEGAEPCTHVPKGLCRACRYIRSEFDRQWKAKAALGSHIHHMALSWAKGEGVETDATTEPYMDALEQFYIDTNPKFIHLERTVHFVDATLAYRGQFDFIAELSRGKPEPGITRPRCTGLWDIKTGGFYPIEQTLQLAAYRYAILTTWKGKEEIINRRVPEVDEAGVLMLHDDGTYELIALPADQDAHFQFLVLRSAWSWAKGLEAWDKERVSA